MSSHFEWYIWDQSHFWFWLYVLGEVKYCKFQGILSTSSGALPKRGYLTNVIMEKSKILIYSIGQLQLQVQYYFIFSSLYNYLKCQCIVNHYHCALWYSVTKYKLDFQFRLWDISEYSWNHVTFASKLLSTKSCQMR